VCWQRYRMLVRFFGVQENLRRTHGRTLEIRRRRRDAPCARCGRADRATHHRHRPPRRRPHLGSLFGSRHRTHNTSQTLALTSALHARRPRSGLGERLRSTLPIERVRDIFPLWQFTLTSSAGREPSGKRTPSRQRKLQRAPRYAWPAICAQWPWPSFG